MCGTGGVGFVLVPKGVGTGEEWRGGTLCSALVEDASNCTTFAASNHFH